MNLHVLTTVFCLGLAACGAPPESRVALSEPGAAYDARLTGKWVMAEEDGAHYLHITPMEDAALLDVLGFGAGYGKGDPVRWLRAVAHGSDIDGETYYNVKRVAGFDYSAEGEPPGYMLLRMKFTGDDELTLCFLGGVWGRTTDDLVEEGLITGYKVEGDGGDEKISYTVIDMTRPALVAAIREAGPDRLFPCMDQPFVRIPPGEQGSN